MGYSITRRDSYENLHDWLHEVKASCSTEVLPILIGNKSDLENHREVSLNEGLRFKKDQNLLYFAETSAKSGDNVDKLFVDIAKFIYHKYKD